MNIIDIMYLLTIKPLELLFEVIFYLSNSIIANPGISIIVLSLSVNFLVLPLYIRADALQKEERDIQEKLNHWVRHIRRTFKGDERFMMLQAYYRENDYRPSYVLKTLLPLMLQIPFFIAAYRFLSGLSILQGLEFGPIKDLGAPDALISVFGLSINMLPIMMTLINIISSSVYTKGAPIKEKIQVYSTALIFLFFLYGSPSGLVFYWTLNNLFSLIKNLFYKLKDPLKAICRISSAIGFVLIGYVLGQRMYSLRQSLFIILFGLLMQLPGVVMKYGGKYTIGNVETASKPGIIFTLAAVYIAIFVGGLIPSAVIASSPIEFVDIVTLESPVRYLISALCISVGIFVIWMSVFFALSKQKNRNLFAGLVWVVSVVFTVDYMFFGTNFGNISPSLQFEVKPIYSVREMLINTFVLVIVCVVCHLIFRRMPLFAITLIISSLLISSGMTVSNLRVIMKEYREMRSAVSNLDESPSVSLSKNGKNVVVLMMDRMISYYVPYIMEENKELYEAFDGFTFYPNTVSFGSSTNVGLPPLMGGYEYTPIEINKRDTEWLGEKHNEALKVMPVIFSDSNYDVTVCNPTYANYNQFIDLSIFNEYDDIKKYALTGMISREITNADLNNDSLYRNCFFYGLYKSFPAILQSTVYDNGNYNALERIGNTDENSKQIMEGMYKADGINPDYEKCHSVLEKLDDLTVVDDNGKASLFIMNNSTPHVPTLLQLPEYTQKKHIDNSEFGETQFIKHDASGKVLELKDEQALMHYHVNMATMKALGEWFDYLRKQGIYDNTRIIIVSDHAFGLNLNKDLLIEGVDVKGKEGKMDCLWFNCTLMVKDYGASGFTIDDTFMTNADVPTLATKDVISDPVNPFTGKKINDSYKNDEELDLMVTVEYRVFVNNGNVFLPAPYYTVKDDIFNRRNWKYLGYK